MRGAQCGVRNAAVVVAALALAAARTNEPPFIRASQLGYLPTDPKIAVLFARDGPLPAAFEVVDLSGAVVLRGTARSHPGAWGQFTAFADLDFSALHTSGTYRVRSGGAESYRFEIREDVFERAADTMLGFMRQQRCGYNPYLDGVCHRFDGRTVEGPRPAGSFLRADGGWHDAGDTLKYLLTSSNATAQLLLAYRIAPRLWADRVDDLGREAANGRADVLDEARWGLEWMLRLHPSPSELYHMVGDDRDHSGWRLPPDDQSDYGWGKGSYRPLYFATGAPQGLGRFKSESSGVANLAGRYAAAMALAYQIWRDVPREREFARICLRAAREVYALGRAHPGVQQGNSYGAPYRYNENTWADDMEWGAAELYRATGESAFLQDARRFAAAIGSTSWIGRDTALHYEFYPFMNAGHFRLGDRRAAAYYAAGLAAAAGAGDRNPWRIGVPFIWCSNNLVAALATQGGMYASMTGSTTYREFSVRQRDWLFGTNPWGTSMFTGLGTVAPSDVHVPAIQISTRPVAGGLVDGPVQESIFTSLKGVALSRQDRFAPFQSAAAVYHDDWQDYSSNEPTMDGTASAVLLMALQRGGAATSPAASRPSR